MRNKKVLKKLFTIFLKNRSLVEGKIIHSVQFLLIQHIYFSGWVDVYFIFLNFAKMLLEGPLLPTQKEAKLKHFQ